MKITSPFYLRFIFIAVLAAAMGFMPLVSSAQGTTSVTQTSLSFGPQAPNTTSAPQTVMLKVTSGSVFVSGISVTGANAGDFAASSCPLPATLTAPGSCTVTVTFTPPDGGPRSAVLKFLGSDSVLLESVALSGGTSVIKVYDSLRINPSLPNTATWPGTAIRSNTLNLSCPASPTAKLSSSADGTGFIFQDNYMRVSNPRTETSGRNVCTGGDVNVSGGVQGTNCFQLPYESAVTQFAGQDPDQASFAGGGPGSFLTQYGVAPLDISSLLGSGDQAVTIELVDAGGFLGASTINLVTSCTVNSAQPGGTIAGDPITADDTDSQTQTFTFNPSAGQLIQFSTNYATAFAADTAVLQNNTIPTVKDVGIPQSQFAAFVAGTSAAPAVCMRVTGEVDPGTGETLCKGFLIQCTNAISASPSGDGCPQSTTRNLLFEAQFDSPDAPKGVNILPNYAAGTGPGILMGSDSWTTASNCVLVGPEAGNLCPQNTMTEFKVDFTVSGATTRGTNSLFVPVLNMPLPSTQATVSSANAAGWQSGGTASVNFAASPATYTPTVTLPANNFLAAPIYSVTYGVSAAADPLPDSTFPVPGDQTLFNAGTSPVFGTPLCTATPGGTFNPPPALIAGLNEGLYQLHYFATDCSSTEELKFTFTPDPDKNWASFKSVLFGVDNTPPAASCTVPATGVWYNHNVTVGCSASDNLSGFAPAINGIAGSLTRTFSAATTVAPGGVNPAATIPAQTVADLAGNSVSVGPYAFMIDLQAPVITGPTLSPSASGNTYTVGQVVKVTYSCSDGSGSGLASCSGPLPSGSNIDTSAAAAGTHTFTVVSTDVAGNAATPRSVTYTVVLGSADVAVATLVSPVVKTGANLTYLTGVVNLSSTAASGVVVTNPLPAGTTFVSAIFANVSCTVLGCTAMPTVGTPCTFASNTVTCNVGNVASIRGLTGVAVKLVVKVTQTAGKTVTNTVTAATGTTDPQPRNNTFKTTTLVTK